MYQQRSFETTNYWRLKEHSVNSYSSSPLLWRQIRKSKGTIQREVGKQKFSLNGRLPFSIMKLLPGGGKTITIRGNKAVVLIFKTNKQTKNLTNYLSETSCFSHLPKQSVVTAIWISSNLIIVIKQVYLVCFFFFFSSSSVCKASWHTKVKCKKGRKNTFGIIICFSAKSAVFASF